MATNLTHNLLCCLSNMLLILKLVMKLLAVLALKASLLSKRSSLNVALRSTKFITVMATNLLTICCVAKVLGSTILVLHSTRILNMLLIPKLLGTLALAL
jgi:hypothetical protein